MAAINDSEPPVHPADERIAGCRHVVFTAPGEDGPHSQRSATSIHPGWLDRSPCGTGTSAKLAQLHARGELAGGRGVREPVADRHPLRRADRGGDRGGRRAGGTPEITGAAWLTGMGSTSSIPTIPFPAGFAL